MLSGRIQRKGIAATSCVRCVVTASSSTEALAARPSQRKRAVHEGGGSMASWTWGRTAAAGSPVDRQAVTAQMTTKQAYAADHAEPCSRVGRFGSTSSGYVRSASMDAAFESANRRYGRPPRWRREYQACSSGLVEESRK